MNNLYFKIEHSTDNGNSWRRSLHQGKPSEFTTRYQAVEALKNITMYPQTLLYRVIRVTEEVVCDQPEESPAVA